MTTKEKKLILVVDDEEHLRFTLGQALKLKGYSVITACDGVEAIEILKQDDECLPNLIMLDYMMPNLDGLETLKHIRQKCNDMSIPVIIMTAFVDVDLVKEAIGSGTTDVIGKPFDTNYLLLLIEKYLQQFSVKNI